MNLKIAVHVFCLKRKLWRQRFAQSVKRTYVKAVQAPMLRERLQKSHKPIPVHEKKKSLVKICSPCGEKSAEAVKFCEECEEYLCPICVEDHLKRKATRNHVPIEISLHFQQLSESEEADHYCNICSINGQKVKADQYCIECTELLCTGCTNVHKNSKATRLHKLVPECAKPQSVSKHEDKLCEPCNLSSIEKLAVKYCKECKEFLCDHCGKRHGLQKITKFHELKDAAEIAMQEQFCDVCIKINENNSAILFCQECEEQLCEKCVRCHKNQRATKNHVLLPLNEKPSPEEPENDLNVCDPCSKRDLSTPANHYCENCELYFCDACKDKHSRQRLTKDHVINDARAARTSCTRFCGSCLSANDEMFAVSHCTDCSEDLCEECTTFHKIQKQSKKHKLIDINEAPNPFIEECVPCRYNDKVTPAVKGCVVCKEYLCQDCCRFHTRYKQTMNHELKDIEVIKKENKRNCDPCMFSENKEVDAALFCKDCEEFLCSACTDRHRAAKLSRNHTLLTVEEGRVHISENALFCDPCKYLDKSLKAFAFCKECRELLCDLCIKQHSAQKQTRQHEILTDLSKYKSSATEELPRDGKEDKVVLQKEKEIEDEEKGKLTPISGKPTSSSVSADSVTLVWERPDRFDDKRDYYQVSYREAEKEKWRFFPGEHEVANVTVIDLKANTKYIFRVRVVHPNGEGLYSEESDVIHTIISAASKLVDFSTIVTRGKPSPSVYGVPITEIRNARNIKDKTKKFEVGKQKMNVSQEKTIMLVGATGTGKSTLVDGIVNYALGVNWSDQFRFTIIDLEDEEKDRHKNQALSQTEWITVYTVHPEPGGRLDYRLNIIDTPGFGDTRGLQRDQEIVEQIRALFSESGAKGVACIDAICFLIKAPDARLTAVQNYIFQSIMALFGKDVEQNICSLITFADGIEPPVLSALRQSGLPFGQHFTFNNSGLFAQNSELQSAGLSPMFWDMGLKSFNSFFGHLDKMETKSLTLTKNVLEERKKLETTVQNLQPQVDAGLAKLNMLNEEIRIIKQHKLEAESNKDFEYEVEEIQQRRHELPKGTHTTNCLHCNFTCHKSCMFANDNEKKNCGAMDRNGNCTQCSEKCNWQQHANTPYIFEYISVKKKQTYEQKLKKYQDAEGKRLSHEQVVQRMGEELNELQEGIEYLMETVKDCNERLGEIALRPNPLSMVDHIELMIKSEHMEQKEGYMKRIAMLEDMKQKALITTKAESLKQKIGQHSKTFSVKVEAAQQGKTQSKAFSLKKFLGNLF